MIVPQSAGGSTDPSPASSRSGSVTRLRRWGQPPGASSISGTDIVVKATPDGYAAAIAACLPSRRAPQEPAARSGCVVRSRGCDLPRILVVHPSVPASTVKELTRCSSQARRAQLRHQRRNQHPSGPRAVHVQPAPVSQFRKGGAPGMTALRAARFNSTATILTALPHESGRLRH